MLEKSYNKIVFAPYLKKDIVLQFNTTVTCIFDPIASEVNIILHNVENNQTNINILDNIVNNHQAENSKKIHAIRLQRDNLLFLSDWIVRRHQEQIEAGGSTSITTEKYNEWLTYRQSLRDFPSIVDLENIIWPTEPN